MAQVSLPQQPAPFAGVAEEDHARSTPDWPKLITAPKGAPNVLLVVIDDVGFGATSITGGRSPPPRWTAWPAKACVTIISTSTRCATHPRRIAIRPKRSPNRFWDCHRI
jgi:hypothetical protein